MNNYLLSEKNELTTETVPAQEVPQRKKKYIKPMLSEPEGVLDTTKFFFFQAGGSGLLERREGSSHGSR